MAYIPPHKRHLEGGAASSPPTPELPPESLIPRFQRNVNLTSEDDPDKPIRKWFVVGLADQSRVFDLARLEPVTMGSFKRKSGENPLALVLKENGAQASEFSANPWIFVAESVKQDLFSFFQQVKDEMRGDEFREINPKMVVRFGRILFRGNRWSPAESMNSLKQLRRYFDTDIPPSYMEHITSNIVPKIGFEFEEEKDVYYVKFTETKRPDSSFISKCYFAKATNQLELDKFELDGPGVLTVKVRHLVTDMSCLDKNLDLRLTLSTRRISAAFTDEEHEDMKNLINSAILDSEVKGGLRWPLGKQSSGNQYTVARVWHTKSKTFKNSSMRLKVEHTRCSKGKFSGDVTLKMLGIVSLLQEQTGNTEPALEILQENIKLIWMHFLS